MTDTSEQVRREFEAWMNAKHPELARLATMRQGDGYDGRWMTAAWEGYKAGRESAGGAEPLATCDLLPTFPHELDNHMGAAKCVNRATPAASQPPAPATLEAASKRMENPEQHENSAAPATSGESELRQQIADSIVRRIAERYKNCNVHIYHDFPEMTPVEAVLRCAAEEGFVLTNHIPAAPTPDDATLRENLAELAAHWESEGKRCYELAHKRTKVEETVMAQSVRFFECARELREAVERYRAIRAGGKG